MIVTEETAKTKRCPTGAYLMCVGSGCMAWKPVEATSRWANAKKDSVVFEMYSPGHGRCGMASST